MLEITAEDVEAKLPIVHGVWADGSLEAARIAKRAQAGDLPRYWFFRRHRSR